jgi:hypothetical protein
MVLRVAVRERYGTAWRLAGPGRVNRSDLSGALSPTRYEAGRKAGHEAGPAEGGSNGGL